MNPKVFSYGTATVRLEPSGRKVQPYFTHQTACAVLRGLPEYMTLNDWWTESFVHVFVEGTMVGTAQLWNPYGDGRVALMETMGAQYTAEPVATA